MLDSWTSTKDFGCNALCVDLNNLGRPLHLDECLAYIPTRFTQHINVNATCSPNVG